MITEIYPKRSLPQANNGDDDDDYSDDDDDNNNNNNSTYTAAATTTATSTTSAITVADDIKTIGIERRSQIIVVVLHITSLSLCLQDYIQGPSRSCMPILTELKSYCFSFCFIC